jgi:small-conductance mechanosensitive channel
VRKVEQALISAGSAHPKALLDPAPSVFLTKFGDSSIDFELVVWSTEMSHRPSRFKSDLNFLIEEKLREAGIEIPNPQRDLHIRSGVLRVQSLDGGERDRGTSNPAPSTTA